MNSPRAMEPPFHIHHPSLDAITSVPESPIAWILIGILSCACWTVLFNIFSEPAPKTMKSVHGNSQASPIPTTQNGSPPPEKIPDILLQRLKNGDVKPLPHRVFTKSELSTYTGRPHATNPEKSIYFSVGGLVYDVSSGKAFYGPEGMYAAFAGCDATIALAKNDLKAVISPDDKQVSVETLEDYEVESLKGWELKLQRRYPVIGYMDD